MTKILSLPILATLAYNTGCDEEGPLKCSFADRDGTYLATFVETDGTCGPLVSAVIRVDNSTLPEGCELVMPDTISENQCVLSRSVECPEPMQGEGYRSRTVAITEQQDANAESLTGVFSLTILNADGVAVCVSTYDVDAERQ